MGFGKKLCLTTLVVVVVLVVGSFIVWNMKGADTGGKPHRFISKSPLGIYKKAAVATNGPECSKIGSDILEKDGSAVDAAIAALLCEGVASLHSMGLGGGFLMTIWNATTKEAFYLDARETAPGAAHRDMYKNNPEGSLFGGLAIAVPGELKGYWRAHQLAGRLPWKDLFEPTIELCNKGHVITEYLYRSLKGQERYIRSEAQLKEILIDPETDQIYKVGDKIKRPLLAKTLRRLADADDPVELFYKGDMAESLVNEIRERDGIVTMEDFANYKEVLTKPLEVKLGNMTLYSAPPPGSGAILSLILNVMEGLVSVRDEKVLWQRIVETFKWAYAKRTQLGDPHYELGIEELVKEMTSEEFANEIRGRIEDDRTYNDTLHYGVNTTNKVDHGTAHVSVLAPDGSAVSVTSTINQVLGSKIRSKSTGIIFNDEMDDFSSPHAANGFGLPPSPSNFIKPNKRPMSSMAPTVVLGENGNVTLVIGAAGGSKITTAVAAIMIHNLWRDYDIKEAIDAHRLHHQLYPMEIQYEKNFPIDIQNYLWAVGHELNQYSGIGSAVTAVSRKNHQVTANSDYRREGTTTGF